MVVTSTDGSALAVESKRVLAFLKADLRIRGENALQDVKAMAIKVMASFILSDLAYSNHKDQWCCNIQLCWCCLAAFDGSTSVRHSGLIIELIMFSLIG